MISRIRNGRALLGNWRMLAVVGVVIFGYFVVSFSGLVASGYQLNQRASSLQQEIQELKAENEKLEGEVRTLLTEEAVEKLAREQLGWAKPGETAIVLVPARPEGKRAILPATSQPAGEMPNWQRWWDVFLGN